MKERISIPVYYYVNDDNKIVIDYKQMKEDYKFNIRRLKIQIKSTNERYR